MEFGHKVSCFQRKQCRMPPNPSKCWSDACCSTGWLIYIHMLFWEATSLVEFDGNQVHGNPFWGKLSFKKVSMHWAQAKNRIPIKVSFMGYAYFASLRNVVSIFSLCPTWDPNVSHSTSRAVNYPLPQQGQCTTSTWTAWLQLLWEFSVKLSSRTQCHQLAGFC